MANITGTEGIDTLQGTTGSDTINALGGDDLIIGSLGSDTIDGGDGNDSIDFSGVDASMTLASTGKFATSNENRFGPVSVFSSLTSIETIIGNPNKSNLINDFSRYTPIGSMDVDLSADRLTFFDNDNNFVRTVTVQNFDNINAIYGNNRLAGNDRDNNIRGGGSGTSTSTIVGSKGNDILDGRYGAATLDYGKFERDVKFVISGAKDAFDVQALPSGTIDKGSFGKDKINNFNKIIGATDKGNTLDASNSASGSSLDINLSTNSLKVTLADGSVNKTEVLNFVNVIGGTGNDTIVGSNTSNKLTGGGGNDTITGGTKNDRLTGTNNTARGVSEVDTLTGGGGRDKFILGDRNGAYYLGNGSNDYATITDFNVFQDSIEIGNLKDYSFALEGTNTIDLFSGKDVNTRDLIAKIQLADLGLAATKKGSSTNSRSMMSMASMSSILDTGASTGVDALAAKIDILSGDNSTADTVV